MTRRVLLQISMQTMQKCLAPCRSQSSILQRWSRENVNNNLGGGRWCRVGDVHGVNCHNAIYWIEKALARRRTYIVSTSMTRLERVPSVRTIWSGFAMNSGRTTPIIVTLSLSTMIAFISKRTPNLDESTFPCGRCTYSFEDISQARLRSTSKMFAIGTLSHLLLSRRATLRCVGQDL